MPLVHPNTSEAPLWRFPPKRREYPFTAWRAWHLSDIEDGWYLESLAANVLWEQPVIKSDFPPLDPKAWGHGQKTDPAHVINTSGIWTVYDRVHALLVAQLYRAEVFGEVSLWGRVARHELGYRAEWCMIKKLLLYLPICRNKGWHRYQLESAVIGLERRYGCDVEVVH